MSYKNKTYICFDADTDIKYYRLMQARKENDKIDFNFYDAHDINNLWKDSSEETIKRKLRERLKNAKIFVVLIGENTKNLYKFVRWEMEIALELNLPIIWINLNKNRKLDNLRCPPIIKDKLVLFVGFDCKIIKKALDHWETEYYEHKKKWNTWRYYFEDSTY